MDLPPGRGRIGPIGGAPRTRCPSFRPPWRHRLTQRWFSLGRRLDACFSALSALAVSRHLPARPAALHTWHGTHKMRSDAYERGERVDAAVCPTIATGRGRRRAIRKSLQPDIDWRPSRKTKRRGSRPDQASNRDIRSANGASPAAIESVFRPRATPTTRGGQCVDRAGHVQTSERFDALDRASMDLKALLASTVKERLVYRGPPSHRSTWPAVCLIDATWSQGPAESGRGFDGSLAPSASSRR